MSTIIEIKREVLEAIGFAANLDESITVSAIEFLTDGTSRAEHHYAIPQELHKMVNRLSPSQLQAAMTARVDDFLHVHAKVLSMPNSFYNGCYSITVVMK